MVDVVRLQSAVVCGRRFNTKRDIIAAARTVLVRLLPIGSHS